MAKLKINLEKVSGKRVSKVKVGKRIAEAYAAGNATRAQIAEMYAFVPDDSFGEETFDYPEAFGLHHEIIEGEIVLSRKGLAALIGALGGARNKLSLSSSQLSEVKRHARKHYRQLEEDVPEKVREALEERQRPLEELTQGSREYDLERIRRAFNAQFNPNDDREFSLYIVETFDDHVIACDWSADSDLDADEYWKVAYAEEADGITFVAQDEWEIVVLAYEDAGETEESRQSDDDRVIEEVKGSLEYVRNAIRDAFARAFDPNYESSLYIVETFGDYVIVTQWGRDSELAADEYYRVTYQREGESYTFAARDEWEIVELAYQAKTTSVVEKKEEPRETRIKERKSVDDKKKRNGKRFEERVEHVEVDLLESSDDGPRQIRVKGAMTVGVINGNSRRYGRPVARAALEELHEHLHESPGQGRAIQILGEAEHPSSKTSRRPNLLETVTKWDDVSLNGDSVDLLGHIIETRTGKDILALAEGGVGFGVSMRGRGRSDFIKENGETVEEVKVLHITGFDLVLDPSFENVALVESVLDHEANDFLEAEMDIKQLRATLGELFEKHPDMLDGLLTEKLEKMGEEQLVTLNETVREKLGATSEDDIGAKLEEAKKAMAELAEHKRVEARNAAIEEATKDLKYGKQLNAAFGEELAEVAKDSDGSDVAELAESMQKRYDTMMAAVTRKSMGDSSVEVLGPVLEDETGIPEYARAAHEITESLIKRGKAKRRDYRKRDLTKNEVFAARYIERFDEVWARQLKLESQQYEEAETASDLDLPYSVSRAVVAEALPQLVATGVFDIDVIETTPTKIWFEQFAGETGYTVAVSDEAVTASDDTWVAMANKYLTPGTAVVTLSGGTPTYVEGSDYVIDYAGGRIMTLSSGDIADAASLEVDYTYTAIQKGEMAVIERGEVQLTSQTLETAAVRLATQISTEAVVFSRSQLGWDATAKTLASLIAQLRRKIDQGLFYLALSAGLQVESNSGGTWSSAGDPPNYDQFVRFVGSANVKVEARFYEVTALLLSATNGDLIANWQGFTQAGKRPDSDLDINGYIGRLKGKPVVSSTEFSDGYALSLNNEVVMHRVYMPMRLKGPYQTHDASTGKLIAAEEWYAEEFNGSLAPVPGKAAYVKIT